MAQYDEILRETEENVKVARISSLNKRFFNDVKFARRWIKRKGDPQVLSLGTKTELHPQKALDEQSSKFKDLWNPGDDAKTSIDRIEKYLDWIPEGGFTCPKVELHARGLQAQAQRAANSSAGCDGWEPKMLLQLPLEFWKVLAEWANPLLDTAEVLPNFMRTVHVSMIPKDDGGMRPISVASAVWRIIMGSAQRQMTEWINEWAPAGVCGDCREDPLMTYWLIGLLISRKL